MINRPHSLFALGVAAMFALAACSNNSTPAGDAGSGGGNGGGAGGGSGGGVGCMPGQTYGGGEASLAASSVTALLVDETGAPVAAGQPLYICGLDICSAPGMTADAGPSSIATNLTEKKPAFNFGDAISYAAFAIPLGAGSTDFTQSGTGKIATAKLAGKPGAALTPGTSAISGDVTVALAANAVVGIDTLVYSTSDEQMFRAVSIPLTNLGPVIGDVTTGTPAEPANFALVYGMAPAETTVCPPAQVTVALPASLGWTAGAGVEFWITTDDTRQLYAPYAGWAKMSDGVVSADGTSATTSAGQGFNLLESFAVRLK